MKMIEIREIARQWGLKANGGKVAVIRRIQEAEHNQPCFRTRTVCGQKQCAWREDCLC